MVSAEMLLHRWSMKNRVLPGDRRKISCLLLLSALVSVTGCVGYVDGPRRTVYAQPLPGPEVVVAQDEYVYYPAYHVYYNNYRRQYYYQDNRAWVNRPGPRGVSVDVLLASPSVRMDFHDSPARHHATVARQYPRNWRPPNTHPNPPGRGSEVRQ